jgi:two-component system NtrC family response regulator
MNGPMKEKQLANILIVDDDKVVCASIARVVSQLGLPFSFAHTLAETLSQAESKPYDVIFLDTHLPDGNGLDLMIRLRSMKSGPEIIVITSNGDPDEAATAITRGAWDYVEKPASVDSIRHPLVRVLEYRADRAKGLPMVDLKRKDIIGKSPALAICFDLVSQAANSDVNVLITGESGTGKELFAKAIHYNSARAKNNFVIIDCTSLPETLVESVLFGHTRGAFTSAYTNQDGLIKHADKGTIFLDEIGELPLSVQKSFLRVLQERRYRPVGGSQEMSSDFRLVAATNRNLENMVGLGQFREDLLFRMRTVVIDLPPLRACPDDIHSMILHYIGTLCDRFGIEPKGFSVEFLQVLTAYRWPGNVRELIHTMEKALLAANDEPMLYPKHLPTYLRIQVARDGYKVKSSCQLGKSAAAKSEFEPQTLKEVHQEAINRVESEYLKDLLAYVDGNIMEACRISGLSRSRLYTLLKKHKTTT